MKSYEYDCLFIFPFKGEVFNVFDNTKILLTPTTSCQGRCKHHNYGTCQCDTSCISFGDCCFDYAICRVANLTTINQENSLELMSYQCLEVEGFEFKASYFVSNCSVSWDEDYYVRPRCEDATNEMRVFDKNGVNYRNIYCAICN